MRRRRCFEIRRIDYRLVVYFDIVNGPSSVLGHQVSRHLEEEAYLASGRQRAQLKGDGNASMRCDSSSAWSISSPRVEADPPARDSVE